MFQFCAETLKGDTTCIGGKKLKIDQRNSAVPYKGDANKVETCLPILNARPSATSASSEHGTERV